MGTRIKATWSKQPAGRPVRPAGFAMCVLAALIAAAPVQPAIASDNLADSELSHSSPQWITSDQRAAIHLITMLQSSALDGIDPQQFDIGRLLGALREASAGNWAAVDRANRLFDRALVDYVTALRSRPSSDWVIIDPAAAPRPPSADSLLAEAAVAASLERWVDQMPFMHPADAEMRRALAQAKDRGDRDTEARLKANLHRLRFLPADGRYVLVNAAAQRLFMYEDGRVVDSMKVVVGKPINPTPVMAATIKFTALNPYWNVPTDLAAERIAPHVLKQGTGYLRQLGYVVLSDWSDSATPVDPETVDWQAVADGQVKVRVRQDPGPHNSMGRMKFMFPNPQGVYLQDTPDKELLNEAARLFSGGCVRLEDAPRLASWLYGRPLDPQGAGTEQPVPLETPVPVYIAYLTAMPDGGQIVYYDDIYGKDRSELAASGDGRVAAR